MNKINVLEIATLPETVGIGGVSIHVQRLMDWSEDDEDLDISLYDYKKNAININLFKLILWANIVHIHLCNPYAMILYIFISKFFFRKTIITIHGNLHPFKFLKNKMIDLAVFLCDIPIVLNDNSYNIAKKLNKSTKKLYAFIPEKKCKPLDDDIISLINDLKHKYQKIVCTNAFRRVFTTNGEEIYGIDFLISYFTKHNNIALIISDPSKEYSTYYKDSNLSKNIVFINKPHSFTEIIKLTDISIRATATDGDSLSVREGLFIGKPVIATNRVSRPAGVILFNYNDEYTLDLAVNSDIKNICPQIINGYFEIRKLYLGLY